MSKYDKLSLERKDGITNGEIPEWYSGAGYQLFKEKYLWCSNVCKQYVTIANTAAYHLKGTIWEAQAPDKFYDLLWKGWLSPSTPILANMGKDFGLPVSCSGCYIDDSIDGFYTARHETAMLTKYGFGTSAYLGDIRPRGAPYKGGKASGVLPVIKGFVRDMEEVAQGAQRRGAIGLYLPIDHADFDEVADFLHATPDGVNIGWVVTDSFISWLNLSSEDGIGCSTGELEKAKETLRRYQKALKVKMITGRGYFFFVDKANRHRPDCYKELDLDVKASNLCTEIMLHSSEDYTYTCQPSNAPIISREGLVTLGDIQIGDDIWSKEGWTKVVNKVYSGVKPVYEYRTSSGSFIGTEDHRVVSNGEKIEVKNAECIDPCKPAVIKSGIGEGINRNINIINGLMLGDGTLRNGKPVLCVGENDYDYYDQLSNVMFYDGYKYFREVKVPIIVDIGVYTYERDFDPQDWHGVENDFLRGLYSANGSAIKQSDGSCHVVLTQTSKNVANKVLWMLMSLGYSPRLYKTDGVESTWNNGCYVGRARYDVKLLKRADVIRFGKEIGFIQQYKQEILNNLEETFSKPKTCSSPILEKIYLGEMEVFHIEVDNDSHTYWTGGLDVSNCVLSSMNLAKWDEWKDTDAVFWATLFLDCVAEEFIQKGKDIPGLQKAVEFTKKGRALGLGVCGWHTLLMQKGIPFESLDAQFLNTEIFRTIRWEANRATVAMCMKLGQPEWCKNDGNARNTHLLAIAPTKSTALIMGGVSEGINPVPALVYTQNTAAGEVQRIDPTFLEFLKERHLYDEEHINEIEKAFGSCQDVTWMTDADKQVFKTAFEIDQSVIIRHAAQRQKYIDQGQSVNLFFSSEASEEYISRVHKEAFLNEDILSLYYCYSKANVKASEKNACEVCQ